MTALHLRRVDPARNMCRFYRLDVQPDLFGRVLLMKQRGRVGTEGRMMMESFDPVMSNDNRQHNKKARHH
jgi:predicted DNA-binding WGR domain protein